MNRQISHFSCRSAVKSLMHAAPMIGMTSVHVFNTCDVTRPVGMIRLAPVDAFLLRSRCFERIMIIPFHNHVSLPTPLDV